MPHPTLEADPFSTPDFRDQRRREPRVICEREVSMVRCLDNEPARPTRVQLTDCSLHGLGVMAAIKLEAGEQVLVKVEMNRLPMMLMYSVRYCVPMASDAFRVGLRFSGYVASKFRGEMRTVLGAMMG